MDRRWKLVVVALVVNAMMTGATWDQTIKQLPARQVIGVEAFSTYSRAGDPDTLTQIFDQFEQLNLLRALLQTTVVAALAWTLLTSRHTPDNPPHP